MSSFSGTQCISQCDVIMFMTVSYSAAQHRTYHSCCNEIRILVESYVLTLLTYFFRRVINSFCTILLFVLQILPVPKLTTLSYQTM